VLVVGANVEPDRLLLEVCKSRPVRLRVLLTDGSRTVEVIWRQHTGTDIYYGNVGWNEKTSYHASGQRHSKRPGQTPSRIESHHPLVAFHGQLQLCAFGLHTGILQSKEAVDYKW
jgi:hypothetical protein